MSTSRRPKARSPALRAALAKATLGAGLAAVLAAGLALAEDDPYAPEKRPNFPYPTERDYSHVFGKPMTPPGAAPPLPSLKLGDGPWDMETWAVRHLHVSVVARGFTEPRDLEILPDGTMLVTESAGTLRMLKNGVLDPNPVPGVPADVIFKGTMAGLQDIALHPDFAKNHLIYISYHKKVWGGLGTNAIWRGTWTGHSIEGGKDIFVSKDVDMEVSALAFGSDGKLYMSMGGPGTGQPESVIRPQHPDDYAGKTVRLNDDGTVPPDDPFVGKKEYKPGIFTLGHRNLMSFAKNPQTGELWASEMGPNGGDEINIIRAGQNYGWPIVSQGRWYYGDYVSENPYRDGMTRPWIEFVPSPALSGMMFYTGDKFPGWKNSLFVGAMRFGEAPRTGHLLRISFNDKWQELSREILLWDLHQRIRDVVQSPDGLIYVITGEPDAAILKLEPGEEGKKAE
jgi:glucose/arabinose dehydrogenase